MVNIDSILDGLLALESENEIVEFKEANNDYHFDNIGKYFSALSNEANLGNKDSAWLVFGVRDSDHSMVGTEYRLSGRSLNSLKEEIGNHTINRHSFREIHVVEKKGMRVVLFEIPPAPKGMPISWKGHFYARDHESIQALNIDKLERIRKQSTLEDRSAGICSGATIDDLDEDAIKKARDVYIIKNPQKEVEINSRDNIKFLNKAKVTIKGNITRTAILLLGKEESEHFLSPAVAKISWILKNRDDIEIDYQHFKCPLILSVTGIYSKIRNLKYRYITDPSLFPEEVDKYDPYVIREALNNCIAHQDYTLAGKINIVENEDNLVFTNKGSFIPETIESVIDGDSPSEYYRNRFLADAMVNFNMIDTIGSGIKKMFISQKKKFFPLPDYDLSNNGVSVNVIGKVLDMNYARKLAMVPTLSLHDIMLLDKVQKRKVLTADEIIYLRKEGFIEGRKPNFHISLQIAQQSHLVGEYVLSVFNINEQREKVFKFIELHKKAGVAKMDMFIFMRKQQIFEKGLSREKQIARLKNILSSLKKNGHIITKGKGTNWVWIAV